MRSKSLHTIIRLVFSVGLIVVLLLVIDRDSLVEALAKTNVVDYLIGAFMFFLAMAIWAVRWYMIIRAADESVRFPRVFVTTMIGIFYSNFLPQAVGADVGRMYEISEDGKPSANMVSTVLLDRLIGLISLVLMAVVAMALGLQYVGGEAGVVVTIVGLTVGLVVGWIVFFNRSLMRRFRWTLQLPVIKRFEATITKLYDSLHVLQGQPKLIVSTVIVSFVLQVFEVIAALFIAKALGLEEVTLLHLFIFVPIIWVITTIPISISGFGLREGAFVFFLAQVGVSSADAVAMSLLFYFQNVIVGLIGGFFLLQHTVQDYFQPSTVKTQQQ